MTAPPTPSYISELPSSKILTQLDIDALRTLLASTFQQHAITVTGPADDFPPEFGHTCTFQDELSIPTEFTIHIFTANLPDVGHLIEIWRIHGSHFTFMNVLHKIGVNFGVNFPLFPRALPY